MAKLDAIFQQAIKAHQSAQWDEAVRLYQKVIAKQADYVAAYINLGAVYRQLGEVENAKQSYQQAINLNVSSIEAWFNLGNILLTEKSWQEAEKAFEQVLHLAAQHQGALSQCATLARLQNNWQQAIKALTKWISYYPDAMNAHLELGNAYRHLGQNILALTHYQRAVVISPTSWKANYGVARLADQLGKTALFNDHYKMALHYSDTPYLVCIALAQTRLDNGNLQGAAEQFQAALEVKAEDFDAQLGLASAQMGLGEVAAAKVIFQHLSQRDDVAALSSLAKEMWTHKFFTEACTVLKKVVSLRPDLYDTHLNLAKSYSETWQFSKALPCIEQALTLKPDCEEAQDLKAILYLRQGQCDKSIARYEHKLQREPSKQNAASLLFNVLYSSAYSAVEKAKRHQSLMQTLMPTQQDVTFSQDKQPDRVLNIGYISADFRDQHPVGLFVTPVLQHHDATKFNITAYYNNRTYDASTKHIQALTQQWHDVSNWADERLQQQIIADKIDILVDLSGQTAKNRLGVFALRAAPVQVSWLGYPHSTGLEAMDYLIADPVACPPENDHLCSEQVYRLPSHCVFCYPTHDQYAAYCLPKEHKDTVVFGSFNNLTKVNSDTLTLWIKLLHAIPHAHLYLKTPSFTDEDCIAQFYDDFAKQGISRDRLTFTGPSDLGAMMEEYKQIDIGLDPIPYNGGTTSLQALWMGVPIVSLAGDNFCGRMGASIMYHAGLSDWVANSEEDYIAIAKEKASDVLALRQLKSELREQLKRSVLFDNVGFTQELEKAYQTFWKDYCQT